MESICQIGAIMQPMTTIISDPQPAERWLKYEPIIRADLIAAGIDPDDPPTLVRALAKTVTRESRKGIFLTGGTGSGKSRRMQFLHDIKQITMIPASDFGDAWSYSDGNPVEFREFCRVSVPNWSEIPKTFNDLIIDDLGTEAEKYACYGNFCDVMRDKVIPMRYDAFIQRGARTHFTCNLSREQLRKRYGERCYSRLCEMCAFIACNHPDRRITR